MHLQISFFKINLFFFIVFLTVYPYQFGLAQAIPSRVLSLSDAVNMAISNNPGAKIAELKIQEDKVIKKDKLCLDPLEFTWSHGQLYGTPHDNRLEFRQNLGSPMTYSPRNKYLKNQMELSALSGKISQKQLIASVKEAYFSWVHQIEFNELLLEETKLYENLLQYLHNDSISGNSNELEKILAETEATAIYKKQLVAEEEIKLVTNQLNRLIYAEGPFVPVDKELDLYSIQFPEKTDDKFYPATWKDYFSKQTRQKDLEWELEKAKLFPAVHAGYFFQQIYPLKALNGFEFGFSLPLWGMTQSVKIRSARMEREIAIQNESMQNYNLEQTMDDLKIQLDQEYISITYYREKGMIQSDNLIKLAGEDIQLHKISVATYIQITTQALNIKEDYLKSLLNYNIHAVELEYYIN